MRRVIPTDASEATVIAGKRRVELTNLRKPFWPRISKGRLLQYYSDIAEVLVPHLRERPMVMKRYPNGMAGEFFFMKRVPESRPAWIRTCRVRHSSGNVIDFPIVEDAASLLWMINLGCIDLNPWYSRCDDVDRPDFLHFDLDPVKPANFERVRETALLLRQTLEALDMPCYAKTTGSRGIHVYVPIVRGPLQKDVWGFAKAVALRLAQARPALITAVYRVADRPAGRVLVDYNQNAWGRTLASVYSVRPKRGAPVSAPVSWEEVRRGIAIDDFRLENMPARIAKRGDLWKSILSRNGRVRLDRYLRR